MLRVTITNVIKLPLDDGRRLVFQLNGTFRITFKEGAARIYSRIKREQFTAASDICLQGLKTSLSR